MHEQTNIEGMVGFELVENTHHPQVRRMLHVRAQRCDLPEIRYQQGNP